MVIGLSKTSNKNIDKENIIGDFSEKVKMSLNVDSEITSSLLIQRLTELYEDPIVASVRETVSNALDSIVKAKSDGLVKITSPTKLSPYFVVEDNGVGMSYEDLKNTYSKYGASTKTEDFSQIGAYGLGAKAPLSYCTEFTVTSIKDGEKTSIVVVREELINYINVVEKTSTKEKNGTTVSIPVSQKDINSFKESIVVYKEFPIPQDNISFEIDGLAIESDKNYICVTDDLITYSKDNEIVRAKVWINRNPKMMCDILSVLTKDILRKQLSYSTGGWVYNDKTSPYSKEIQKTAFLVELKPGVVGFNSSRDSIVKNERYEDFANLVYKEMTSKSFLVKVIDAIKRLPLEEFKAVSSYLLFNNLEDVEEGNGRPKLKIAPKFTSEEILVDLEGFTSVDGWNILEEFEDLSSNDKKNFSLFLRSSFHYSRMDNLTHNFHYSLDNNLESYPASVLKDLYEEVFFDERDSNINLNVILMRLMAQKFLDEKGSSHKGILLITNISQDKKQQAMSAFSKRKSISEFLMKDEYWKETHIIYTEERKEDVVSFFKKKDVIDSLHIMGVEEILGLVQRKKPKQAEKASSLELKYLETEEMKFKSISLEELSSSKKKITFLVSKSQTPTCLYYLKAKIWLANKTGDNLDNIILVVVIGNLKNKDIDELSSLGELYEFFKAGITNKYENLIAGRKLGQDFYLEKYKDSEFERLMAINLMVRIVGMNGVFTSTYDNCLPSISSSLNTFSVAISSLEDLCSICGIEFSSPDLSYLRELRIPEESKVVLDTLEFLSSKDLNYFTKFLTEEDKEIIEKTSYYLQKKRHNSKYRISFREEKVSSVKIPSFIRTIYDFDLEEVRSVFLYNKESHFEEIREDIKNSLEIIIDFVSLIGKLKVQ